MADVTISELAGVVGVSVEKLLSQVKEAGLPHTKADELISNDDKNILLVFLRRSHGDRDASAAAPKKITLKRRTWHSEIGVLHRRETVMSGQQSALTSSEAQSRHQLRRTAAAELEPEVEETAAAVAPDTSAVEEAEKEAATEVKPETTPPQRNQDVPPPESDANRDKARAS